MYVYYDRRRLRVRQALIHEIAGRVHTCNIYICIGNPTIQVLSYHCSSTQLYAMLCYALLARAGWMVKFPCTSYHHIIALFEFTIESAIISYLIYN
jgi:hypothetical protein